MSLFRVGLDVALSNELQLSLIVFFWVCLSKVFFFFFFLILFLLIIFLLVVIIIREGRVKTTKKRKRNFKESIREAPKEGDQTRRRTA